MHDDEVLLAELLGIVTNLRNAWRESEQRLRVELAEAA
jgi:hypothetical protein